MSDETVFTDALAITDPTERAAFLDRACTNPEQRQRLARLLAAVGQSNPLDRPPVDLARTGAYDHSKEDAESNATVGDRVGPYKLLEKIGEGGMGEVWVADQLEPIKRRVALKLIKPGMDSRSVLGRFEAERQALAVMDHPNIAKVLDAGTSADGRPYFVMELVKGTPITEFADARKLTPKQRLELFVPVCQAIQHAHMKGIIHRDIKPGNVLVALHDETPVPKVIDFGVAKAVGQQLTEKTIYTGFGALVGTPAYMAPEQATFNQLDVDTRADVYALGVLLYELLAGSPPIEKERLKKAALDEVLRLVREEEPPRPSQRLSTSHTRASIAATRGSEPAKLSALMKGEIDWIVMKALEKDRTRRYETAIGLAADVRRYLAGDAVEACPPTLGYRLRKAYRKNRAAVLVGTAFALLLTIGIIAAAVLAMQARRAEAVAERNADAFYGAILKADAALQQVERTTADQQIDAALLEYKNDSVVGLLRLARTLRTLPNGEAHRRYPLEGGGEIALPASEEHFVALKALREFATAAVISAGQEYAPLLPPFGPTDRMESSPDGRLLLNGQERVGIELLAIPSLKRIGVLREGSERLVKWGFSPNGKTIYTQDTDSVVRFWNTDGTFRAKTPLRPERFIYPAGMTIEQVRKVVDIANAVLVADGIAVVHSKPPMAGKPGKNSEDWKDRPERLGPADLYSTRTGQFIRRLDRSDCYMRDFQLVATDRWLIYYEYDRKVGKYPDCQLVIVSTDDGRELARLPHSTENSTRDAIISPTGKWVVTRETSPNITRIDPALHVRLWSSANWQRVENETSRQVEAMLKFHIGFWFVTDDIVDVNSIVDCDNDKIYESKHNILDFSRPGFQCNKEAIGIPLPWGYASGAVDGSLIRFHRTLIDAKTFERLKPPSGRKYHPDLAKLAPDGRFFEDLDTVTEKELPLYTDDSDGFFLNRNAPGVGQFGIILNKRHGWQLYILPNPDKLTIPSEMLELWAKVVVGGELTAEGTFQPWDQPTWAAKQRELAAMKPPYADFSFPGWAATEPSLWYRIRANQLEEGKERDQLMDEWRRRTGRDTKPEADTWRTPGPAQQEPKK